MRNLTSTMFLGKVIIIKFDEFQELVEQLTEGLATVEYDLCDGAFVTTTKKADELEKYWEEPILKTLSKHFEINANQWHSDDIYTVYISYEGEL